MKTFFTLWLAFTACFSFAQVTTKQLSDVNSLWEETHWKPSRELPNKANFEAKIKLHLLETADYLRSKSLTHLDASQQYNRAKLLKILKQYAIEGKYPQNEHKPFKTPIFIDNYGTHCAVGYLMQQSGASKLARTIRDNENLAYLNDIKTEGVTFWAYENGFSLDELALIQPTYSEPIGSIKNCYLKTEKPILKMASYGENVYLLLQDTTFKNNNQAANANYVIKYFPQRGYAAAIGFPRTSTKPKDIAIYNNEIYVVTSSEVYSADLSSNSTELNWINEGLTGEVQKIFSSDLGIVIHYGTFCYTKNFSQEHFRKIPYDGVATSCNCVLSGNFIELLAIKLEDQGFSFNSYIESEKSWYKYPGSNIDYWVEGVTSHNESYFSFSTPFRGDSALIISRLNPGGSHETIPSENIFDVTKQQSDWRINDIVSSGDKAFVIGKFDKSLSITNLPGRAIIELTRMGSATYYPLPVTSIFEEVYSAVSAGNQLFVSTDLGLFSIKTRLANIYNPKTSKVTLYPNPILPGKSLKVNLPDVKSIKLFSNLGQLVVESLSDSIDIPAVTTSGIYHCTIETTGGLIYTEKIIVQ